VVKKKSSMKTSNKGIKLIKQHEGLRLEAYRCPGGVWTIGYGHTKGVKESDVITEGRAERLLREDLEWAEKVVSRECPDVNQNQFDALVSFVYNVGEAAFRRSTLLRCVKANPDNLNIRGEFARWTKGGGSTLPGLVRRRREEAELYFTKED